ncbi:MAG TPA: hypothetical protein H9903_09050 [Candidatus Aquabacterium excrementipullorum]|nr:hypothetical protein [Candidatus Aquabacterium excrementipullorum]
MSQDIESLYQAIGAEALDAAPDLQGTLLVYAEVDDGLIAASVFYEKGARRTVTFKDCPPVLEDLVYALWETWQATPGQAAWGAIEYVVRDGSFNISLTYPDQMDAQEGLPERRPRVIQKYFGDAKVDYADPA